MFSGIWDIFCVIYGTVCEGGCDLTRRRGDAEKSAEFNAADGVRGGMGWETRKNAPKNVGGPEGTPPERLRYGAATKNQRVRMGFRREDIWGGWGIAIK